MAPHQNLNSNTNVKSPIALDPRHCTDLNPDSLHCAEFSIVLIFTADALNQLIFIEDALNRLRFTEEALNQTIALMGTPLHCNVWPLSQEHGSNRVKEF